MSLIELIDLDNVDKLQSGDQVIISYKIRSESPIYEGLYQQLFKRKPKEWSMKHTHRLDKYFMKKYQSLTLITIAQIIDWYDSDPEGSREFEVFYQIPFYTPTECKTHTGYLTLKYTNKRIDVINDGKRLFVNNIFIQRPIWR